MGNQLTRFDRRRYTFYSPKFGTLEIEEPDGWNDDEKELIRSEKFFGIMTSLSNNLSFYGKGFQYLKSAYDIDGIKANVTMECEERDDNSDIWQIVYTGNFDFSTYQQEENYINIKFNESQFFKNIESRWKDKFELDRLDDLKGGVLQPITYDSLRLRGRDIFRETLFDNGKDIVKVNYKGSSTFDALVDFAIPLKKVYDSDDNFFEPAVSIDSSGYLNLLTAQIVRGVVDDAVYNSGTVYYLRSERQRKITINIELEFRAKYSTPGGQTATFFIYSDLLNPSGLNNVTDDIPANRILSVRSADGDIIQNQWKTFTVNFTREYTLGVDQSLGLRVQPFFGGTYERSNQWQFEFSKIKLVGSQNEIGNTTQVETLTVYKVVERLLMIITGKNTFESDLLSGFWKDLVLTNGYKIRNIPLKNNDNVIGEVNYKPITTSLEEVFEGLQAIDDVAFVIKNNTSRIERKSYVFRNDIIDLGEVYNIKRKIIEKLHFSSIEIGTDFNGVYEEVNGLDEFNIRSTYTTCIDNVDNPHKAISKVRYDAYGITLAQLKPYAKFPKEDTKYDKENFFIDTIIKEVPITSFPFPTFALMRVVRTWEDDFDEQPTGIFSPDTAFNLRLSPFNSLLRKGKYLSTGLQKYPTELLKYSSTEGNSQLVTVYPERAVIQNDVLASPYFLPEEIEFERKTSMAEFRNIVLNPYSLFRFVNEFGKEEYCYIYPSVKPNKEGKFVMIKANI